LNCTYCNYKEAAAPTCSAAQMQSTFTVQIMYNLIILQQNCSDSDYTKAATGCSYAQEHNKFTVQIMNKL